MLLKNRGMLFYDETKAKEILKSISYYRLKGYWWDMQSDALTHKFKNDSYFEEVIERHEFDRELRFVLFYAIEIIEVALRTKMIYHLSQEYGGLWYRDERLFVNQQHFNQHLFELENEFARSGETFVKEYKKKNNIKKVNHKTCDTSKHPDAWIILEVATFGNLSKMYKNLQHQLPQKSVIANEFGLNLHSELSSWLESIAYLRNIVAHHSRIWSRTMVKMPKPVVKTRNSWIQIRSQQNKPYYIIAVMLCLCNAVKGDNLFKDKMLELFNKYQNLPLYKLGLHNQWKQDAFWK